MPHRTLLLQYGKQGGVYAGIKQPFCVLRDRSGSEPAVWRSERSR